MGSPKVDIVNTEYGNYLVFASDFDIGVQLKEHGGHDLPVIKQALQALKSRENWDTIIDVGAHLGTFSIPVSVFYNCSVRAFEPQRQISQLLGANFGINGIENAWVYNVAVGGPGHPETIELPLVDYSAPGNFGAYAVDPDIAKKTSAVRMQYRSGTDRVEVRTIDSYRFKNVGLVKIDVEGMELDVLQGAQQTLEENNHPPVLFESWTTDDFSEQRTATIDFIQSLGYGIETHGQNVLAQHPG